MFNTIILPLLYYLLVIWFIFSFQPEATSSVAYFNVVMEATLDYIGHKDLLHFLLLVGLDACKHIQSYHKMSTY